MAEWLKALDSKSSVRVSVPGVRIPVSPPSTQYSGTQVNGEVTEWTKVHDWKSCVGQLTEGSNPSLSAIHDRADWQDRQSALSTQTGSPHGVIQIPCVTRSSFH
jgi:hypothetical protein